MLKGQVLQPHGGRDEEAVGQEEYAPRNFSWQGLEHIPLGLGVLLTVGAT